MNLLGIDLSLTAPGVAYDDEAITLVGTKKKGVERLAYWRDTFAALVLEVEPDLAVIEGYSFGSHLAYAREGGELGGVIRLLLHDAGVPFVEVSPSTLKKFAVGRGGADKMSLVQEAVKLTGRTFPSNDAVDAWWLLQAGLTHYAPDDARLKVRPKVNRDALESVAWPTIKNPHTSSRSSS